MAMTTTLLIWGFYLISLLENNSACICHNCHNWTFKAVGSLEIIGEGVKNRGVRTQRCLCQENAAKSPGHSKTTPNKTRRQSGGFHQFRGELPGYGQNAQRLYNESLKTFPSGSLSLPLIHICTTPISTKCRFKKKPVTDDESCDVFPYIGSSCSSRRKRSTSLTLKPFNIFWLSHHMLS